MSEEKKYLPQERYIKEKTRRFTLNVNRNTDADLLEHLEKCDNVQGYLKRLVRADMKRSN